MIPQVGDRVRVVGNEDYSGRIGRIVRKTTMMGSVVEFGRDHNNQLYFPDNQLEILHEKVLPLFVVWNR